MSDAILRPVAPTEVNMYTWLRWEIRFDDVVRWGIAPCLHYTLNPYWN